MIAREWQSVKILSYSSTKDAYGQTRMQPAIETDAQFVVKPYSHSNVNDPRFLDIELVCLTESFVSTDNEVKIGNKKYTVAFTIPSGRYTQVFLRNK